MDEQSLPPSLPPSLAPFAWSVGPRNADLSSRKKAMHDYGELFLLSLAQIRALVMLGFGFTINVSDWNWEDGTRVSVQNT